VKALLVGDSGAADAVARGVSALGHEVVRVAGSALHAELAAADSAVVILLAGSADARARIAELRGPDLPAAAPLFVVTDRDGAEALAELYAAGADECLAWPREAPLLGHRLGALTERIDLRRKLAEAARAEGELRTREERLRTLVDLASDSIFIKDRAGRYVFINPAGARTLGSSPEEIIGKTDPEVFGEVTGKDVISFDEIALKNRQPIHYEAWRVIHGDNRLFTTSKFAYVSPEGDLLGVAGITRDTTDLRRLESAEKDRTTQRLSHQAALLALAQMDEGEFVPGIEKILDTDAETLALTRVSFWSLQADPPTLVSHEMRKAGSGSWANGLELRARDLPRYIETLQENRVYVADDARALTEGTGLGKSYLEPNGVRSILDAPVWLRGSLAGVVCHEAVGEPRKWTTEEQDFVTRIGHMVSMALGDRERELAAKALQRSESRMRTLIEHLPDAIFVLREGCFVFVNAAFAAYLGYSEQDDVIGRQLLDVVHPEDAHDGKAIAAGSPRPRKVRMLRRDHEAVFAEVAGLALVWDGDPATVAIARDLTERNRLEAQLLLADRMASVGTLAAGVAHEINNPLGYVLGNLTALMSGLSPDVLTPDLKQALADSVHGAKRVRDIVHDLQTFSRGDASRRSAPVDVLRVMDVSIRMAHSAVRHRARLERDYRQVPAVEATESRLGQIFLNLIVNAAQAMPERPAEENEINVRVTTDGDMVVVEVRDNGTGMTDEVRKRIFDPFYTTKPIGEGTGLGLSICHSIVTSMNGTIEVESVPGLGTTFRVRLPSAKAPARVESIEPPVLTPEKRERILVIDDEPMIGVMLRRLLAAHCDVLPITSPREGLRRIGAHERFDAILCDLMMPRMSGVDFFAELSVLSPEMARRTGFLTGGAVTAQARRFLQEHADVTLEKPVEMGKLRALIRLLAQRGAEAAVPSTRGRELASSTGSTPGAPRRGGA
jgi:PAS domain S-box-containing protein